MTKQKKTQRAAKPPKSLPIEIYSDQRVAEFDAAEAELVEWFDREPAASASYFLTDSSVGKR